MGAIIGIIGKVLGGAGAAGGGGGLLSGLLGKILGGVDMGKSLKNALETNKESTDKLPRS